MARYMVTIGRDQRGVTFSTLKEARDAACRYVKGTLQYATILKERDEPVFHYGIAAYYDKHGNYIRANAGYQCWSELETIYGGYHWLARQDWRRDTYNARYRLASNVA